MQRVEIFSFLLQQERMMVERSKTIMMNDREALKKGGHTINDYRYV